MNSINGVDQSDLDDVKGKIVDLFFWFYAVFMWFVLGASIYRAVDTGLRLAHFTQAALVLLFLLIFVFRRKLSTVLKSYAIIIVTFCLAAGGLLSFGLLSTGIYFLFLFVVLNIFLIGLRQGIYAFIIGLVFFLVVAFFYLKSYIVFVPDNPNFHNSISAWLMALLVFALMSLIMYFFWKKMFGFLIGKVQSTTNHDEQLKKINKLLSREIEARKLTEKSLEQQFEESRAINDEYQIVNKELLEANDKLGESNQLLQTANEKSKVAEQLKTAFLDNMSHEVRTPLNAIVGFTGLLSNDDLKPTERHNYLEIIQASTENLLNVISDIVNIAKIQSNQYTLHFIEFDINALLDNFSERYTREIFINKGDEVVFSIENKVPHATQITTDLECLKIILNKLLDNAMKFTNCGSITLTCEIEDHNLLKIEVVDTGIGIPSDKSQVIFDTFNQVDTTETRKYGGSGLGLSIVKGLIELLCGKVSFVTSLTDGSTFSLLIPILPSNSEM